MALRYYSNAPATSLASSCSAVATSISVNSVTGLPIQYPYTLIIDRGTASEEVVSVTAASGTTLTVTRGADSSTAFTHAIGAEVCHGISAQDPREANAHVNATTGVHGVTGSVVGTGGTQTLTGKTLTSPVITGMTLDGNPVNGAAWSTYTPTLTNITLGTGGTANGRWSQHGKTIHVTVTITLGTGFALSNPPTISLPINRTSGTGFVAALTHTGVNSYQGIAIASGSSNVQIYFSSVSGTAIVIGAITSTTPFAWAASDTITLSGTYEAA